MNFTLKCVGNDFYNKNAFERIFTIKKANDFYNQNVYELTLQLKCTGNNSFY